MTHVEELTVLALIAGVQRMTFACNCLCVEILLALSFTAAWITGTLSVCTPATVQSIVLLCYTLYLTRNTPI